jgi:hypothetical protein
MVNTGLVARTRQVIDGQFGSEVHERARHRRHWDTVPGRDVLAIEVT